MNMIILHLLRAITVNHKDPTTSRVCPITTTATHMPSISNHKFKILIIINSNTKTFIIIKEFWPSHNSVYFITLFKSGKHFFCGMLRRFIACCNVWMGGGIIYRYNILNSNHATAIFIQSIERLGVSHK